MPASRRARFQNARLRLRGRPGSLGDGKTKGLPRARPAFENAPGRSVEGNDPGPGLAVGEDQPVASDFRPAQPDDFAPTASGQKQEPDDIRLLTPAMAGLPVQDVMEPSDFLAGQKAREDPSRVPFHGLCGVGFEVAAGDGEIDDLREKIECVIGVAGSGPAEPVEPSHDLDRGNTGRAASSRRRAGAGGRAGTGRPFSWTACNRRNGPPSTHPRRSPGTAEPHAWVLRSLPVRPCAYDIPGAPPRRSSATPDRARPVSTARRCPPTGHRSVRRWAGPEPRGRQIDYPRPYIPAREGGDGRWHGR